MEIEIIREGISQAHIIILSLFGLLLGASSLTKYLASGIFDAVKLVKEKCLDATVCKFKGEGK